MGADRPPELAQGLQRRLQVRRQARRGRGSDPGHLPEDLQGAGDVRPARELPDLDHQHQPQPVHRPLPQRAEGAADDRARGRHRPTCSRRRAIAGRTRRPSTRTCAGMLRQALETLPLTLRTAVVLRDLQELSYQEIADRLGLPEGTVKSRINRGRIELAHQLGGCRTSSRSARRRRGAPRAAGPGVPEYLNEPHHRTRQRHRGRARRRVAPDVSAALGVLDRGHAAHRRGRDAASSSTCRRSATSTARRSAA